MFDDGERITYWQGICFRRPTEVRQKEAALRSAVSRAYYAAFHAAEDYLKGTKSIHLCRRIVLLQRDLIIESLIHLSMTLIILHGKDRKESRD